MSHTRFEVRSLGKSYGATRALHDISFTVQITADVDAEKIEELKANVERSCPILNLLKNTQSLSGRVVHVRSNEARRAA